MIRCIILIALWIWSATVLSACEGGEAQAAADKKAKAQAAEEKAATTSTDKAAAKIVNVNIITVTPTILTEQVVAHGVTSPIREITYSAEIPGRIEHLTADIGDTVRNRQVLARIDFKTLKAQAHQADASHALAKSTYDRVASLKGEDLVSEQRVDETRSAMDNATAQQEIAQANLAKSTVRASFRGVVTAKYVEKGEYVAPGVRLYDVVDYRTVIVEAQLPETQVARIAPKAEVAVDIAALGEQFKGTVETVIPTADRMSKTFTLRVKIKNPDRKILVGMSATVRIAARVHNDVIAVPQSAVVEERDGRVVFIAEDGIAKKRIVALGPVEGDRVVVETGLAPGESLVVLGQRDLSDLQPINIVE
ncbi:MAG: efflux RND transporter periplasmic adaptor subunit [Myxococcota bacterium]|nr:efflux RND transporter periplasmic adaptor subunit [Myxococcota bacterium]